MTSLKHGQYLQRTLTCAAPGCGKEFITRAYYRGARYCSDYCRVQFGKWSFRASQPTNARVYGTASQ